FRAERHTRLSIALFATVLGVAVFAFTCLDLDHEPIESHRWVTTPFVIGPLLAAAWLADAARGGRGAAVGAGVPALVVYIGLGLGVASTVEWLAGGVALRECRRHQNFDGFAAAERFYDVGCRGIAGATLGERTKPTYVEAAAAYLYTGCRPTFVAGPPTSLHKVKVGRPRYGPGAVEEVQRMLGPGDAVPVACVATPVSGDPICARARAAGTCQPAGTAVELCQLAPRGAITSP